MTTSTPPYRALRSSASRGDGVGVRHVQHPALDLGAGGGQLGDLAGGLRHPFPAARR